MIADNFVQLRSELETALEMLLGLTGEMRRGPLALDPLHALLADLRQPLVFVVAGEGKSGKSSLINALFGHEFADVDVPPETNSIHVFRYGLEDKSVQVSGQILERSLPIALLRDFNVIDTPGTNTITAEQRRIIAGFISSSDLVFFAFSVTDPWSQSGWQLLDLVEKESLKKIVFVLQQTDLRDATEIEVIRRHLQDTAIQKLGFTPPIFLVSARKALLARTTELTKEDWWQESGFASLEHQGTRMLTESGVRFGQLRSAATTAAGLLAEIADEIRGLLETLSRDEKQLARVNEFLQVRKDQTLREIAGFLRGAEQACREHARRKMQVMEQELSFGKALGLAWHRQQWTHDFPPEDETKLRERAGPQLEHAVQLLETDLRSLWPRLQDAIEAQFSAEGKKLVRKSIPDFADQRRELLRSIEPALAGDGTEKPVGKRLTATFRQTGNWLHWLCGIAAAFGVTTIVLALIPVSFFAGIAGILAILAATWGLVLLVNQRRRVLTACENEMEKSGGEFVNAIEKRMRHAVDLFYAESTAAFQPLETLCLTERQRYEPLAEQTKTLNEALTGLRHRLGV